MKLAALGLAATLLVAPGPAQSLTQLSILSQASPAAGGRVLITLMPAPTGSEIALQGRLTASLITTRYGFGRAEQTVETQATIIRVFRGQECLGPGCSSLVLEVALPADLRFPPGFSFGCDDAHYFACDFLLSIRDNGRETHLIPFRGGSYSPSFPPCLGALMACGTGQSSPRFRRPGERVSLRVLGLGAVQDAGDGVLKTKLPYAIDYVYRPKPGASIEGSAGVIPVEPEYLPDLHEYALRFEVPALPEGARSCVFDGNLELTLRFADDSRFPLARADLCVWPPEQP